MPSSKEGVVILQGRSFLQHYKKRDVKYGVKWLLIDIILMNQ